MHKINKYVTKEQLKYLTYIIGILIIIGIIIGAISFTLYILNSLGYIVLFLDWIGRIGYYGNAVMILCIIVVNFPFMMGYGSMMIASGFLFGFKMGLLTVVIGCQIGVFFVGLLIRVKYFREKSEAYINSKPYVKAMMEELILHKVKFAFLIRMSPIPLGVQNLVLSLSGMPFWQYMVTSFLGLIIEQAPLVYIGSTLMDITQIFTGEASLGWEQILVIVISAIAIILLIVFLFFVTKRAFAKVKAREMELKKKAEEEQNEEISIELSTVSADEKGESKTSEENEINVGDGEDLVVEYEGGVELNDYPHVNKIDDDNNDRVDDQKIGDNDIKIMIDNGDDHFDDHVINNSNSNSVKNKIKKVLSKNKENKKREIEEEEEVEIELDEYRPSAQRDDNVEIDLETEMETEMEMEMEMEHIPHSSYPFPSHHLNNNNINNNNNFDDSNVNNNNNINNNINKEEERSEFTEVRDNDQTEKNITVNFDFNQFNGDDQNGDDQTFSNYSFGDYSYPTHNNDDGGDDDDDRIYQFNPSNDNDDNEML